MSRLDENLEKLKEWFEKNCTTTVIAFSGGVDSCLVVYLARKFLGKEKTVAVIADSPSLKRRDLGIAEEFCTKYDINLQMVNTKEMLDPGYTSNPVDRCYFCKTNLYTELRSIASLYPDSEILNGQNFDDYSDHRPGIKAAAEFKVLKPLADCRITKSDIRELALHFDLMTWDKPASPCLSSRIPYGKEVSSQKLKQIEDAENILLELGFKEARVRHYGKKAKIEVPLREVVEVKKYEEALEKEFFKLGFESVEIDEEGLISGKLNRGMV